MLLLIAIFVFVSCATYGVLVYGAGYTLFYIPAVVTGAIYEFLRS